MVQVENRDGIVVRGTREERQGKDVQLRHPGIIGLGLHPSFKGKYSHDVKIILVETIIKFHNLELPSITANDGDTPSWIHQDSMQKLRGSGIVI